MKIASKIQQGFQVLTSVVKKEKGNALLTIHPYFHKDMWVFDDAAVGLTREPFVAGADDFIDYVLTKAKKLAVGQKGFNLIFSKQEFHGAQFELAYLRKAYGGTYYRVVGNDEFANHEGVNEIWLCPALNKYFALSPRRLFVKFQMKG